jgi:hypothetical protein
VWLEDFISFQILRDAFWRCNGDAAQVILRLAQEEFMRILTAQFWIASSLVLILNACQTAPPEQIFIPENTFGPESTPNPAGAEELTPEAFRQVVQSDRYEFLSQSKLEQLKVTATSQLESDRELLTTRKNSSFIARSSWHGTWLNWDFKAAKNPTRESFDARVAYRIDD